MGTQNDNLVSIESSRQYVVAKLAELMHLYLQNIGWVQGHTPNGGRGPGSSAEQNVAACHRASPNPHFRETMATLWVLKNHMHEPIHPAVMASRCAAFHAGCVVLSLQEVVMRLSYARQVIMVCVSWLTKSQASLLEFLRVGMWLCCIMGAYQALNSRPRGKYEPRQRTLCSSMHVAPHL